jgi:hypothetical protein
VPFVRVNTSIRSNLRLSRVSHLARLVWLISLCLAEDLTCAGARLGYLEHVDLGPLTLAEIGKTLDLPVTPKIAAELIAVDLWRMDGDCFTVPRFKEQTTPKDPASAERVRRYRERKAPTKPAPSPDSAHKTAPCNGDVTVDVTPLHVPRNDVRNAPVTALRREREERDHLTVIPPSPPEGGEGIVSGLDFTRWFLQEGLDAGVIPGHIGLDLTAAALREDLDAATALLASYGLDECQRRADRLIAAKGNRKIRRPASIAALAQLWDSDLIAPDTPPAGVYDVALGLRGVS